MWIPRFLWEDMQSHQESLSEELHSLDTRYSALLKNIESTMKITTDSMNVCLRIAESSRKLLDCLYSVSNLIDCNADLDDSERLKTTKLQLDYLVRWFRTELSSAYDVAETKSASLTQELEYVQGLIKHKDTTQRRETDGI